MSLVPYIAEDILNVEISLNEETTSLHTFLKKLDVQYELNKIPFAKLTFIASNPETEGADNPLASETIEVTSIIEIKVTEGEEPKTLFKGIVTKVERNTDPDSGYETKIECKDECFNLIGQQEVIADENFEDKMNRFLNHLSITNEVDLQTWGEEIVSKTSNVSPWDYIVSYLDALGLMTTIKEGVFQAYNITSEAPEAKYLARNGSNVFEFQGRQEPAVSSVVVQSWNAETQSMDDQTSETGVQNGSGTEVIDVSQTNYSADTVHQIALARASKNALATVTGSLRTFGNLQADYGDFIMFENVNPALEGASYIISMEHHTIEDGCWNTEYRFGLENNRSFTESSRVTRPRSEDLMGQSNTMQGLQIGVVTKIHDDPANQFRIKVRIPSISSEGEGVWARLASFQAGPDRGAFFIPEVDDEVVLGCFNNNPDTPVILGKLYSSGRAMPFEIEENNNIQGIVSKEGTKVVIDDDKKEVEISTRTGNKLLISDDQKGFVFEDEQQNKIIVNDQGITLDSKSDITLKAAGNINIEGVESTFKASGNMTLNGSLIQLN